MWKEQKKRVDMDVEKMSSVKIGKKRGVKFKWEDCKWVMR